MNERLATYDELKIMYIQVFSELKAFKSIAKDLLVMMDEWNLTKCGKNSKVRRTIHKFKELDAQE